MDGFSDFLPEVSFSLHGHHQSGLKNRDFFFPFLSVPASLLSSIDIWDFRVKTIMSVMMYKIFGTEYDTLLFQRRVFAVGKSSLY